MQIKIFKENDFDEPNKENKLGEGGQGIVYKLQEIKTQKSYAIKHLNEESETFLTEMNILIQLDYPTLIHLYGIIIQPHCIIMDYYPNKTVQYYIDKAYEGKKMDEEELKKLGFNT